MRSELIKNLSIGSERLEFFYWMNQDEPLRIL